MAARCSSFARRMIHRSPFLAWLFALILLASAAGTAGATVDFEKDIRPLLLDRCDEVAGGCVNCCLGDVCGLPPEPNGTCKGLLAVDGGTQD